MEREAPGEGGAAKCGSTWCETLMAQLSQERAVELGLVSAHSQKGEWHHRRGPEQALLHVEVHTAPGFTTPHKPSIVTNQL